MIRKRYLALFLATSLVTTTFAGMNVLAATLSVPSNNKNVQKTNYIKSLKTSEKSVQLTSGESSVVLVTVKVKGKTSKKVKAKVSANDKKVISVKVGKPNKQGLSKIAITGKSVTEASSATINLSTVGKNKKRKKLTKKIKVFVAPKTSETSTTPSGPTIPSEPTVPSNPTITNEPTDPNQPSTPSELVIPDEPNTPSESVTPDEPSNPNEPIAPEEPSNPSEPIAPDEPSNPSEPVTPDEPSTPDEPVTPEEPSNPSEPIAPEEPSTPYEPTTPDEPVTPYEPTTPDEPVTPYEPTTPDEPVTPYEPTTPDEPVTPYEPTTPDEPVTPYEPTTPNEPEIHEHLFTKEVVIKEATCQETGTKALTCESCGYTELETIELGEHKEDVKTTLPTFFNYGKRITTCLECGSVYTIEQLPKISSYSGYLELGWQRLFVPKYEGMDDYWTQGISLETEDTRYLFMDLEGNVYLAELAAEGIGSSAAYHTAILYHYNGSIYTSFDEKKIGDCLTSATLGTLEFPYSIERKDNNSKYHLYLPKLISFVERVIDDDISCIAGEFYKFY